MKFKDLFNDTNDINEKSIIGFLAFTIMTIFALVDIVASLIGKSLTINEFIFNSFLILVIGVFGISGVEKIMNRKSNKSTEEEPPSE